MRKQIIIFITLSFFSVVFTQQSSEIKVVGQIQAEPNELIGKEVKDANGEVCAGIIVYYSNLSSPVYQSNNNPVNIKKVPGKDFIFLSPDEKKLEIYCEKYLPLIVNFTKYGVKLESGKVWSLTITGNKDVDWADRDLFEIIFDCNIEGVTSSVNGKSTIAAKGKRIVYKLPNGEHTFYFSKDGYADMTKTVQVSSKSENLSVVLEEGKSNTKQIVLSSSVSIESKPQGAEILLNGQRVGLTPFNDVIAPGEYQLELVKPLYVKNVSKFNVDAGKGQIITRTLLPNFGFISIQTNVMGSKVIIDGKPIGQSPLDKYQIESGQHSVKISADLYHDDQRSIIVKTNETVPLDIKLRQAFGTLDVRTLPEDSAEVFVDGFKKGISPLLLEHLPSAKYRVKVSKQPYFNDNEEDVLVSDGAVTNKSFIMPRNYCDVIVKADNSTIFVNNKNRGTGIYADRFLPGTYTFKAERGTQYNADEKSIVLASGEMKTIILTPHERLGELYVFVTPSEANDAEIFINNESKGNAPIPLSLLIGDYTITAKKKNFLDVEQKISLLENEKKQVKIQMESYEGSKADKAFSTSLTRSLILPGLGQFFQKRNLSGTLYLVSFVSTIGGFVLFQNQMLQLTSDYNSAFDDYVNEKNLLLIPPKKATLIDADKKLTDATNYRNYCLIAAGAVYILNVLDIYIFEPDWKKYSLDISIHQQGLAVFEIKGSVQF